MNNIESILKRMEELGLDATAVSKQTSLAFNTVDNFIKQKTKPSKTTITVIKALINSLEGNETDSFENSLQTLELTALQNWDKLKKRPGFAAKIDVEIKEAIILRLEEIIKNNSK